MVNTREKTRHLKPFRLKKAVWDLYFYIDRVHWIKSNPILNTRIPWTTEPRQTWPRSECIESRLEVFNLVFSRGTLFYFPCSCDLELKSWVLFVWDRDETEAFLKRGFELKTKTRARVLQHWVVAWCDTVPRKAPMFSQIYPLFWVRADKVSPSVK